MTEAARAILEQVMKLPPAERVSIACKILETVEDDGELSPEWTAEIERRARAALASESPVGDEAHVVLERLERRLAERRKK